MKYKMVRIREELFKGFVKLKTKKSFQGFVNELLERKLDAEAKRKQDQNIQDMQKKVLF